MTAQNQRDPDGTDILGQVRDGLADLKANVISRWGRVPHVAADPTSPPDGAVWVRSDTRHLRYRANGVTVSARAACFSSVGTGGTIAAAAETTVAGLVVADQGCAGTLKIWATCYADKSVAGDKFFMRIADNVTRIGESRNDLGLSTATQLFAATEVAMVAGTGKTINLNLIRVAGAGNITVYADGTVHRIDAIFVPT